MPATLESLLEAIRAVAGEREPAGALERARLETERLFGTPAALLAPGEEPAGEGSTIPLRAHDEELGAIRLGRRLDAAELVAATALAEAAARESENARLLAEAQVREAERSHLSEQLVTAEQDERRRLANELHDGAVQSLAGIALMVDAALHSIGEGRLDEAREVIGSALLRQRETIRSLRDLSFALEPVVLRDRGLGPAVRALAEQLGLAHGIEFELDVEAGEALGEKTQAALYQIVRQALNQAIRRGPPARVSVRIAPTASGGIETAIADDGAGERRRATFDALAERARTLNGKLEVERGPDGGTAVRVLLPPYAARR